VHLHSTASTLRTRPRSSPASTARTASGSTSCPSACRFPPTGGGKARDRAPTARSRAVSLPVAQARAAGRTTSTGLGRRGSLAKPPHDRASRGNGRVCAGTGQAVAAPGSDRGVRLGTAAPPALRPVALPVCPGLARLISAGAGSRCASSGERPLSGSGSRPGSDLSPRAAGPGAFSHRQPLRPAAALIAFILYSAVAGWPSSRGSAGWLMPFRGKALGPSTTARVGPGLSITASRSARPLWLGRRGVPRRPAPRHPPGACQVHPAALRQVPHEPGR
jgi:hypothetical protein